MRWAVLALALLLGGCFSSNGPVFEEARGDCPFVTPTTYVEVENGETHRFVFERDGAYCKTTTDGEAESADRSLFVPIGHNWWIIQGDEEKPTYALMKRTRTRFLTYLPSCSDFSEARLRRLGVAFDESRMRCVVTDAHQVETLFRSWRSPFRRAAGAYRLE